MIQLGRQHNIPVLVDPKNKDFSIYRGATLLKPNRKEFEEVMGVCQDESQIITRGQKLIEQYALQNLLITRGAEGMTLLRSGEPEYHLPAITHEVYDVTGAGDTVIAVLALALGTGCDLELATLLANRAAGIVVGKLGAATVSLPEIRRAIQKDQATNNGALEEEQLLITVSDAKTHGERIVMTNGCFDILHAGHVTYLEQAKSQGDRLIVAVNDDASVARLKGTGRPINKLEHRMAVLAALSSVDWVVPFSEDTPERLICRVLPDILVKGGDYLPENIAGNQCVVANGGKVLILDFVPGCSTTEMIAKANLKKTKRENVDWAPQV
jgi:D-beta-D-heptose 7-phosphate kinase/D-beta-D-heptose 1-phosphate adenosyltransferase